jgi:hypothetical protein
MVINIRFYDSEESRPVSLASSRPTPEYWDRLWEEGREKIFKQTEPLINGLA